MIFIVKLSVSLQGLVERVAVIFFDRTNVPIEKFMFKLSVNQSYDSKVEDADLEFALRSFLIKLPASESLTKAVSRGKSGMQYVRAHDILHCTLLFYHHDKMLQCREGCIS